MELNYKTDNRLVLTLDAGGINFVFSAIQAGQHVVEPLTLPSNGDHLNKCLQSIIQGFSEIKSKLKMAPSAISFAFPGPADYKQGIIGDLGNLPCFRGGIPLAALLKNQFHLPVFINNDGDLFAFGEAMGGVLPEINRELQLAGNARQYKNLIGITLGTGFGAGAVLNNQLLRGDNSLSSEVWLLSNRYLSNSNAEEGISTRAIVSGYQHNSGEGKTGLTPLDVYKIARGLLPGDASAAKRAFETFGQVLGDSLANLITLFDGLVVIGGGLTGASQLYMPAVMKELENPFINRKGELQKRLVQKVFDYDQPEMKKQFLKNSSAPLWVEGQEQPVMYNPIPRTAIVHSKMGASTAIALGAYIFALKMLDS